MRYRIYFLLLFACSLQYVSCKKDSKQPTPQQSNSQQANFASFSVDGQLINSTIDTEKKVISVVVPRTANEQSLKVNFTLANQAVATLNGSTINSGTAVDFSKIVYIKVVSADKKISATYQVNVKTDLQYFGVTGTISAEKSLNKSYDFYFDQFDGSQYQAINCGPTVTTMTLKWADSTSGKRPADARSEIPESGGWWYTSDVQHYLQEYGVNSTIDTLDDISKVVKRSIDNNNLVIFCLDMYYVPHNDILYQHTEKFYQTAGAGWGHFLLAKGYKQTSTGFYIEIYDPYSESLTYGVITTNQLKGRDRYYLIPGMTTATNNWWPYAIIVAPKGQQVIASSRLKVNGITKHIPVARGR